MDVYDFLNLATDLSEVNVSVFDLDSGRTVYDSSKSEFGFFDLSDLEECDGYEVLSYDIFRDAEGVCLELNISMGED